VKTIRFILGWTAVLMGIVHILFAFPIYEFRPGHLWFIGSGIAIVFAGFMNLLGHVIPDGKWQRMLVPFTNLMMAALFIVATFVLKEPQVYFGIFLFGALGILSIVNHSEARQGNPKMRKQYYFRPSAQGYYAWDVDRLIELTKSFQRKQVRLDTIRETDESFPLDEKTERITWRSILEHIRLIQETDLSYPIILSADGRVMDGMHRVARALLEGRETIEAVQFTRDPEPDYEDVQPEYLP
jgi:hypothetical protein